MKNKRLLAMLLIFVVLGGIAVVCGTVFLVTGVSVEFISPTSETLDASIVGAELERAALSVAKGKNLLFNVDRARIRETMENKEIRVRVENIEAKFPNKIIIKVRERYPVFSYTADGRTAILDAELRILSIAPATAEPIEGIDISVHISVADFENAEAGQYLYELLEEQYGEMRDFLKIRRLIDLTPIFAGRKNYEDSLVHLFSKIEFSSVRGPVDLIITLRNKYDETPNANNRVVVKIWDISERFEEKISLAWFYLEDYEETKHLAGKYEAFVYPPNNSIRVTYSPWGTLQGS